MATPPPGDERRRTNSTAPPSDGVEDERDVRVTMQFLRPDAPTQSVVEPTFGHRFERVVKIGGTGPGSLSAATFGDFFSAHEVTVLNGRTALGPEAAAGPGHGWDLEEHGFTFVARPGSSPGPSGSPGGFDFPPHAQQERGAADREFGPLVLDSVLRATGARRAFWLSHQRRTDETTPAGGMTNQQGPALGFCHTDYGPAFEQQLRTVLVRRFGVARAEATSCGIVLMNLWAPVCNPAFRHPLALLDGSTVDLSADAIPYILDPGLDTAYAYGTSSSRHPRPAAERVPQAAKDAPALSPCHRARHRWVFLPDMREDEAVLFKQYDFRREQQQQQQQGKQGKQGKQQGGGGGGGVAKARVRATFHVAFEDPFHDGDEEKPGRQSIECRVLLMFDEEEELAPGTSTGWQSAKL